jgi:malonate transporter and related proteins
MSAIFAVTFPFFAIVLLGYLAAERRVLPESAIAGLSAFVLFIALPCMLFRFGASRPFAQLIDLALMAIYTACALLMVLCSIALSLQRHPGGAGVGLKDAAFGALVATFPNSGFMGVPLLVGLLGEAAAGPLIGALLVDLVLTSSLCLAIAQVAPKAMGSGTDSLLAALGRALRGAASNPLPWAIALGALVAAIDLALPEPVEQIVKMLADAATPVALFTIGAVLWRARRHSTQATPMSGYLPLALVKLLVHPLLILCFGVIAAAAGIGVSSFGLLVLVLTAALPSASNVSILAERYGANNGRVTHIIMASTVLAFFSFSLIAWGLGTDLSR